MLARFFLEKHDCHILPRYGKSQTFNTMSGNVMFAKEDKIHNNVDEKN